MRNIGKKTVPSIPGYCPGSIPDNPSYIPSADTQLFMGSIMSFDSEAIRKLIDGK